MNLLERGQFLIGFRPENFLPREVIKAQNNLGIFSFRVTRVEYLGSDRLLYGTLHAAGEEIRTMAKLPSTVTVPIEPEESYEFAVEEKHLRFFDRSTGLRTKPEVIEQSQLGR